MVFGIFLAGVVGGIIGGSVNGIRRIGRGEGESSSDLFKKLIDTRDPEIWEYFDAFDPEATRANMVVKIGSSSVIKYVILKLNRLFDSINDGSISMNSDTMKALTYYIRLFNIILKQYVQYYHVEKKKYGVVADIYKKNNDFLKEFVETILPKIRAVKDQYPNEFADLEDEGQSMLNIHKRLKDAMEDQKVLETVSQGDGVNDDGSDILPPM